jgi:hypothetical protein
MGGAKFSSICAEIETLAREAKPEAAAKIAALARQLMTEMQALRFELESALSSSKPR